jgi:hypothetical protein
MMADQYQISPRLYLHHMRATCMASGFDMLATFRKRLLAERVDRKTTVCAKNNKFAAPETAVASKTRRYGFYCSCFIKKINAYVKPKP